MDFFENPKKMNFLRIVILIILLVLLVMIIFNYFVHGEINFLSLFANVLMSASMLSQIIKYYNQKGNTNPKL
jgi:antibiotic biosynthesis monooxygenase (ABM) superfamily enzyme